MNFKNAISWFEIPAVDIERAQKFYETIFDTQLQLMNHDGYKMALFPLEDPMNGVGGALCDVSELHQPSANSGSLIYLNANPDVSIVLNKVVAAGGEVLSPKTEISPEYGYMGVFLDTEGNRVALHSLPEKYL